MLVIGAMALAGWVLLTATGFWLCDQRSTAPASFTPEVWPSVVAVVPARNEADVIARSLSSLFAQDYAGPFRIILVDDNSDDGTGDIARTIAPDSVLTGAPLPEGWTGKLWALHQGIGQAGTPEYLWLTDADIEHLPGTLTRLVSIAKGEDRRLVSFMARLHCEGWAEAALVPAFIWFFMMLYPFNWVNRPGPVAGAAGGCVLVERAALKAAGGIAAMRGALIDDCTLGRMIKRQGPIWLGLTTLSRSIRPYAGARDIGAMIARSAYAQLQYNPLLLVLTVAGLGLLFGAPWVLLLTEHGWARGLGGASVAIMMFIYQPILFFYQRRPMWGLALPAIAAFYVGCTLWSALAFTQGRGGMWKGRAQATR